MNRRKFVIGLGAASASGSALIGSGAFTSVSAERDIAVSTAGDDDAFLRLGACTSESGNGGYVDQGADGLFSISLSGDNDNDPPAGSGVNQYAVSRFDNVFEVCNQGTQPVGVWLDIDPVQNGNGNDAVSLYQDSQANAPIVGEDNAVCLAPGDCVCVGLVARTAGLDSSVNNLFQTVSGNSELVVNADADATESCSQPGSVSTRRLDTGEGGWRVLSGPGVGSPSAATHITSPNSAYANSNEAHWIGPFDDDASNDDPVSDTEPFVYEREFSVNAGSRTLVIEEYGADNPVEFFLDGTSIEGPTGSETFRPPLETGPSVSVTGGSHTLLAEVYNEPNVNGQNPTALLVAARLE
jgi:hypothetical protein